MGFHFFELRKLPDDVSEKDDLLLWLALFRAETEEKLEKIRDLEVPEMEQAINVIKKEGIIHVSNGQYPRHI